MVDPSGRRIIHIAAALIDDGAGRLLLVRKAGSRWFMQAGGKIEPGEQPCAAVIREIREEIGLAFDPHEMRYLGCFVAPAANEADHLVKAEVFHIRTPHIPAVQAEIEEALWVDVKDVAAMPLAPLTRDHILPLFRNLKA